MPRPVNHEARAVRRKNGRDARAPCTAFWTKVHAEARQRAIVGALGVPLAPSGSGRDRQRQHGASPWHPSSCGADRLPWKPLPGDTPTMMRSRMTRASPISLNRVLSPGPGTVRAGKPNRLGGRRREPGELDRHAQHVGQRARHIRSFEQACARQHLPEDHAVGPDVRPLIHGKALGLFRAQCTRQCPGSSRRTFQRSQRRRVTEIHRSHGRSLHHRREPEIEDLHQPCGRHHHVARLQIPMTTPRFARRLERLRDRERSSRPWRRGHGARSWPRASALAPVPCTARSGTGSTDPWMIRRCSDDSARPAPGLWSNAPAAPIAGEGRKHLDRDLALQLRVARAIDLAHATGAEWGQDFVRAEARAGCEG